VRLRVLGPVQIESDDGQVYTLTRRQERSVLAILLLEAGRVVPIDRLCELLWGDDPPRHARRAVHAHIARIRAVLARAGGGAELASDREGYRLDVDPNRVDVHRFRTLLHLATATTDLVERDRMLSEALSLWHGPALHNAAPEQLRERLCADLDEQRRRAVEAAIAAGLDLGRHDELLAELARLNTEQPVRERLVELHMLALYHQGRTSEALTVYQQARNRLSDELGLDPGPVLQQLHRAILRGEPVPGRAPPHGARPAPAPVRPAQLPPDQAGFVGRADDLDELDGLLTSRGTLAGAAVVISAISGTAGVGKTALAVHWAHRIRDQFPDGQLYLNLRGYAHTPLVRPLDALARFLSALGVPAERVPADVDQAASLYRSLLADRRMLVLLDNAASADQVRPLLPPQSAASP